MSDGKLVMVGSSLVQVVGKLVVGTCVFSKKTPVLKWGGLLIDIPSRGSTFFTKNQSSLIGASISVEMDGRSYHSVGTQDSTTPGYVNQTNCALAFELIGDDGSAGGVTLSFSYKISYSSKGIPSFSVQPTLVTDCNVNYVNYSPIPELTYR